MEEESFPILKDDDDDGNKDGENVLSLATLAVDIEAGGPGKAIQRACRVPRLLFDSKAMYVSRYVPGVKVDSDDHRFRRSKDVIG